MNFYNRVYDVVSLIPKGKVATYGDIAEFLGSRGSARMVGWALRSLKTNSELNKSKGIESNLVSNATLKDVSIPLLTSSLASIPAHRVVNQKGLLTGTHSFEETQEALLEKEGIEINGNQIVNLKEVLWIPTAEY